MITQKSRYVLQQNKKIVFIPIIQNLHLICMLFSSDGPSNVHHPVYTDASSYALHDFKGGPNRPRYQQTNGRTPSTFAFLTHRLMGIQIMAISCHLYKFSTNFQQYQNFFMIVRTESCMPRFSITCWLNSSLQYFKLSHIYMFCLRQFFIVLQKKTTDNTLFHRTNPRIIQ